MTGIIFLGPTSCTEDSTSAHTSLSDPSLIKVKCGSRRMGSVNHRVLGRWIRLVKSPKRWNPFDSARRG
jgi:hypothetical protein